MHATVLHYMALDLKAEPCMTILCYLSSDVKGKKAALFAVFICMIPPPIVNLKETSNAFILTHTGTIQWLPDESEDVNTYVGPLL